MEQWITGMEQWITGMEQWITGMEQWITGMEQWIIGVGYWTKISLAVYSRKVSAPKTTQSNTDHI